MITRRDEAVQAIQQPAMARNQLAGVLDAEPPFHRGLEQVRQSWEATESDAPAARIGPNPEHLRRFHLGKPMATKPRQPARLGTKPPMAPAQVFFGLTRGQISGPPIPRPAKKPPISVTLTTRQDQIRADKSPTTDRGHQHRCDFGAGGA